MARLEDLKEGAKVKGRRADGPVAIINVKWHGDSVVEVTYKDSSGQPGNELIFRDKEPTLEIVEAGQSWSYDADASMLRLVSEAYRIRMAYLFDPLLAVHTSMIEPLPHQITAVYQEMLPRQPLRYLLADDPGAGKTIMAGLLIKELMVRGDVDRCLIVCPGNLVDQWQDELYSRLHLPFEILTNDRLEAARTGNAFQEIPLLIARLDKLSRDEKAQAKLKQTEWDLIICDEAHKMSASFFAGEIKETKRRKLGRLLSTLTRHFLLMTATPHNGKEEDFQLFMALLDGDRFEGRFRDGVHVTDVSDLMRRMVKEELVKFDGTPLFPERLAYTVTYPLSDQEAILYERVTNYVREEFNRADALENEGRRGTVGFALTILQRRLASSPEAIYQSLKRRRERLESRLREEELLKRGAEARIQSETWTPPITEEELEDLDDATDKEVQEAEEQILDLATAAQTISELRAEIEILKELEALALQVRRSGQDRKWEELSKLLQDNPQMFDSNGARRKLVIFTEHRDTLNYLTDRIRTLLGRPEAVVTIHGSMGREDRKKAEEAFKQDKNVQVLVATDAAGEGINLQRAHLMVNYDLPWNPNRIEQRFGRIHRIGQTEVCHLWNLVAEETREGDVYKTLLKKLETERESLGGAVFDVLGKALSGKELRKLLIEAIRYGDHPEVRARLTQQVEQALDTDRLKELLEEKALAHDTLDASRLRQIREDMERAEARRLQPHFIESYFIEAFKLLGGSIREREPRRYEIKHVPAVIRNRDRMIGIGESLLTRYERICFEKDLISVPGKPLATFVYPGHPLLDATTDIILERYRDLLKRGAVFLNESDPGEEIRALFYLEHSVADARTDKHGNRRIISRQVQFVEIDKYGHTRNAGHAPYLDYRPLTDEEKALVAPELEQPWLHADLESQAVKYAITDLVPRHFREVRERKEELVTKTIAAVKDRLTKEIAYWDHRAEDLKAQELAGKVNARINSAKARTRADDLQARLQKRLEELERERQLSPLPPVVKGGALVVPGGLIARLKGKRQEEPELFARETRRVEQIAMQAVMAVERSLGYVPRDVSQENCGYDIESAIPGTGKLRFIEVKGRLEGAKTVTITKNEILTALNKPDDFILAVVLVPPSDTAPKADPWKIEDPARNYGNMKEKCQVYYIRKPFTREPDFGVTSVNYDLGELLANAERPPIS
ncbi:MAG: RNA helicase [Deltaproteobacteria bacterium]|nr:MAG: RNA helicase [Deltaproteobacteria bacterium]